MTQPTSDLRIPTLFTYNSHTALITGGATGLGAIAAQALVQNGASVILASRKESQLHVTSTRLNALGPGKCTYIVADVSTKSGCHALCTAVKARITKLGSLINCAGMVWAGPYEDFDEKKGWDGVMGVNVKAAFYAGVGVEELLVRARREDC